MTGDLYPFELRPKANTLDPKLLQAAHSYWAGHTTLLQHTAGKWINWIVYDENAADINSRFVREAGLFGSVTHAVREAFDLFYTFTCLTCHKEVTQKLSAPLRSVLAYTLRHPLTECEACAAEAAQEHDESELDRATDFLLRKIKPRGAPVEAVPIIAAAQSMSISINHLTRARHKLGILAFKAGPSWRWVWPVPEVEEEDPYPWRTDARQEKGRQQNA